MKAQKQTHKQTQTEVKEMAEVKELAEARLEEILEEMAEAEVAMEAALWAVHRAATACREAASLANLYTTLARVEGAEKIARALGAILEIARAA